MPDTHEREVGDVQELENVDEPRVNDSRDDAVSGAAGGAENGMRAEVDRASLDGTVDRVQGVVVAALDWEDESLEVLCRCLLRRRLSLV